MKYKWNKRPQERAISEIVIEAAGGSRQLARILQQRGYSDPMQIRAFLDPDRYVPSSPKELPDLIKGVERVERAIKNEERILVWGDFDVDGQTSTALLYSALTQLGGSVEYHIPVREIESHGILPEFLHPYLESGIDVLLSCDTGIAATEAIKLANQGGVDVIVTDHHDPPDVLPPAYALVNPKLIEEGHPLSNLPGVGVAFKFVEALYTRAGRIEELDSFLDLVALGIVADLALVTEDTRYLLQKGMEVLRNTDRIGLLQLMKNARVMPSHLIDEHIGFQIGPRLNAVGRLADANISVPLLTTEIEAEAQVIAEQLERLNEDRRYKTDLVYESAIEQIERDPSFLQYAVLVLSNPKWHQGVIGIVASRLVEEFGKPTILLAAPEGMPARGSARSIEGYNIIKAIASQAEILRGFGGHPMAAGLAIDREYIDRFRRGVSKAIIDQRTGEEVEPTIDIDSEVRLGKLTHDLVEELELLAPFGPGNPPVNLLCRDLQIIGQIFIGKDKSHTKLVVQDGDGERREILWWNSADESLPDGHIDVVVRVRPGFFRGERQLTITLQDLRISGVRIEEERKEKRLQIIDNREVEDPHDALKELIFKEPDIQIWGEGSSGKKILLKSRLELEPASSLVIWTIPPSQSVLTEVVSKVDPQRVYVFAREPGLDDRDRFLGRFFGLIKFVRENYGGNTTIGKLAAAMAHAERTIEYALRILPTVGQRAVVDDDGSVAVYRETPSQQPQKMIELFQLIAETRAFRRAFKHSADLSRYLFSRTPDSLTEDPLTP